MTEYETTENNMAEKQQPDYDNMTAKEVVTNSSQQMFDNFVNRNFSEEEQKEIRGQIDDALEKNNGTCTISWQGEDKQDKVSVSYVDGKMTKFKMSNRTDEDTHTSRQQIKYKETESSAKVSVKENRKTYDGMSRQNWKCVVRASDDNQFYAKDSNSNAQYGADLTGVHGEKQKNTHTAHSTDEGYRNKVSYSQGNFDVGLGNRAEFSKHSDSTYYDNDGNTVKQTSNDSHVYVGLKGGGAEFSHSVEKENEDGTTEYRGNKLGVSVKRGKLGVEAGMEQKVSDGEGNTLYSKETDVYAEVGKGVSAGVHHRKETQDEVSEAFVSASVGPQRISAEITQYHQDENGEMRKTMRADFNAAKGLLDAKSQKLRTTEYGTETNTAGIYVKGDRGQLSMGVENRATDADGNTSGFSARGAIDVSSLENAGIDISQKVGNNTRERIKLDTARAYERLNNLTAETVEKAEKLVAQTNDVVGNINNIGNQISNTVEDKVKTHIYQAISAVRNR